MNLKISAERGDGMLNYLEQGMILYVMAAVCVIGIISSKPLLQKFDSTI